MRSGARGYLHPFIDDLSIACPVRWYRVPRNRPVFSLPTIFSWDQWRERRIGDFFPGFEVAYQWDNGVLPNSPPGTSICGSATQWSVGCLTSDPVGGIDPETGFPVCCQGAERVLQGGAAFGGSETVPIVRRVVGGDAEGGDELI